LRALGQGPVQPRSTLTLSSYNEAIAAAVAGQGIALGRRPLIDALLRKRQLVVPFGQATDTARAYFLLLGPDAQHRPAAQALARWLVEQAGTKA
jgi:DNA-binding transcriptional LysR family regulator